jgi:DNA-binding response OmpR family regulator
MRMPAERRKELETVAHSEHQWPPATSAPEPTPQPAEPGQALAEQAPTDPLRGPVDLDARPIRLLVIHPDEVASARLAAELRSFRHVAIPTTSPDAALEWLDSQTADVVVLFSEEGEVAFEGTRQLRRATDLPLIVVGPDATAENRVGAFDRGAEDYLAMPVYPAELDRRVRVLVRRDQVRRGRVALTGPDGMVMHVRSHEAFVGNQQLPLTPKEFSILQFLLERRGEVVVPDALSLAIWGYETFGSRNYVEAHISRLRGKLNAAGTTNAIKTVRGVGYVIR